MVTERELLERAHDMRRNPTEPEKRLWRALSNSQIGYKFRRQAVVYPYICDFLCPAKSLAVEIDGDTHDPLYDARRDDRLANAGLQTVRFTNQDVLRDIESVLAAILHSLELRPDRWPRPHPNPSPEGEGLEVMQ